MSEQISFEDWLASQLSETELTKWTTDLLVELCEVPSFIQNDVKALTQAEDLCFDIIERELNKMVSATHVFHSFPMRKQIEDDEYYTIPAYTDHKEIYEGRRNCVLQPKNNYPWLFNAHVDVVPPYYPPTAEGGLVKGRGSNDNKGGVVLGMLVLKLLSQWDALNGTKLTSDLGLSFSIDEEIGGNGSLSLFYDLPLKGKSVVVLEPTKLKPHPANRGALWFQIRTKLNDEQHQQYHYQFALAVVRGLFHLAVDIREKYPHPLFDQSDVQVCMGIMDRFGKFPASACTEVQFRILSAQGIAAADLAEGANQFLKSHEALNQYTDMDRGEAHVLVDPCDGGVEVTVTATGGHMGSKDRGVDAIVKTAFLIEFFESFEALTFSWLDQNNVISLEGGQGFLPSTNIKNIGVLIREAAANAASAFHKSRSLPDGVLQVNVAYDKIHNEAYCSADNAPGLEYIVNALNDLGHEDRTEEITGWQASCDARIFARDSNDVTTFGAGALELAHGPNEHVKVNDIVKAAGVLAMAVYQRNQSND